MRKYLGLLLALIVFTGCSTMLLEKTTLSSLKVTNPGQTEILFFRKVFIVGADHTLKMKTHQVIAIGKNRQEIPALLITQDGSFLSLKNYEARHIKRDGSTKSYNAGDLATYAASNKYIFQEENYRILPVYDALQTGDFLEIVEVQQQTLAPLGIHFSPEGLAFPAKQIECIIETPPGTELAYHVVNDTLSPVVSKLEKRTDYHFFWKDYKSRKPVSAFTFRNMTPALFVPYPTCRLSSGKAIDLSNWTDFGNWYLDLIRPRLYVPPEVKQATEEICKDKQTDKDKMDAIFQYCQKHIRYEQVYLEQGGYIPNDPKDIYLHKYGDCKDYSTLMHLMAKSAGIETDLALCWRGRGMKFYESIPANQFNHVILHYTEEDSHYWYDATNRTGIPGITTFDLANQMALVLKQDATELIRIDESSDNLLSVSGTMTGQEGRFFADLQLRLQAQYAIPFFYFDMYLNEAEMTELLIQWIRRTLNPEISVKQMTWSKDNERFTVTLHAAIPNGGVWIAPQIYTSQDRLFSMLLPDTGKTGFDHEAFMYYPTDFYNRLDVDILFPEHRETTGEQTGFEIKSSLRLPAGPFDEHEKKNVYDALKQAINMARITYKLQKRDVS